VCRRWILGENSGDGKNAERYRGSGGRRGWDGVASAGVAWQRKAKWRSHGWAISTIVLESRDV
jgi:hypothetical protein